MAVVLSKSAFVGPIFTAVAKLCSIPHSQFPALGSQHLVPFVGTNHLHHTFVFLVVIAWYIEARVVN